MNRNQGRWAMGPGVNANALANANLGVGVGRSGGARWVCGAACAVVLAAASAGVAQTPVTAWDEAVHGDLGELYWSTAPSSGDRVIAFSPLNLGINRFRGTNLQTSSFFGNRFEGDAMSFVIGPGMAATQILFTINRSAGLREFLRLTPTPATLVGRTFPARGLSHPGGSGTVTHDLVALFAPGGGPLGPGAYLLSWDNATFNTTMTYTLDVVVVPAPGAAMAACVAGAWAARRRRR